jgi:hypothetical protein
MNIDFIPCTEWQCSPDHAANILTATKYGIPSFEKLASNNGSGIYVCRYNEIGTPRSDNYSVKEGRSIITEQNLIYFPAWVRFFYEQMSANKVYWQLSELVLPHLNRKKTDFTRRDHEMIMKCNNSAPFIYGYRNSGTDMLHLMPTIEETGPGDLLLQSSDRFMTSVKLVEYHKRSLADFCRENKHFLHFDGNGFHNCSREQIREIYTTHIDKICRYWVTRTQIFPARSVPSSKLAGIIEHIKQ